MTRLPLLLAAVPLLAGVGSAGHSRSAACPRNALPLGANAIAPATRVALSHERPQSLPQVLGAWLAPSDVNRGAIARTECGKRVWRRTVVVYIDLRANHPSASLSERVTFVARFRSGYRVWEIVH
jgi:hypothetical protein